MADLGETLLSLAGWLVAAAVTLIGILVASWIQERRRQYDNDLAEVYEPVYTIVRESHEAEVFKLNRLEVPGSWDIDYKLMGLMKSGKLIPRRFRGLRADLNQLISLSEESDKKEKSLVALTKDKLKKEVELIREDGELVKSLNQTLISTIEQGLLFPLLKSRKDEASAIIEGTKMDSRIVGDKELFETKALAIFDTVNKEITTARKTYRDQAVQYFNFLGGVENGVSNSIENNGRPYERPQYERRETRKSEPMPGRKSTLDDHDIRKRILVLLHDIHQKDPSGSVDSLTELAKELGLDQTTVLKNGQYLADKGLIKVTWMAGRNYFRGISITANGIDEIEGNV